MRRERMKDTENGGQRYIGQVEMNWGSHQGQKDIIKIVMVKSRVFFFQEDWTVETVKRQLWGRGGLTFLLKEPVTWGWKRIGTTITSTREETSVSQLVMRVKACKRYQDGQLWQRGQFLLCQERWHESAQDVYQGWNHIEGGDVQRQIWKTSVLTNKSKVTPKWYKSDESAWEIRLESGWGRRNALRGSKLRRSGSWQEQQNIL